MYNEIIFSDSPALENCAYVGPEAWLPADIQWPVDSHGQPLSHLMAIPATWLSQKNTLRNYWISIFIPYTKNSSTHYRDLSYRNTQNPAKVIGYTKSRLALDEARQITSSGSANISINPEIDDDENLASKVDGVDAWLQHEITITDSRRRVSIYGGDLDICLSNEKGILSDGMGYLFLRTDFEIGNNREIGKFFLQL